MLKNKVICPKYESLVFTYVIMVRKEDGSWRFYIDFRKLNSVTHKDANPLPRIDETLESLAGSTRDLYMISGSTIFSMHVGSRIGLLASGIGRIKPIRRKLHFLHWKAILSSMSSLLASPMLHPVFKGYNDVYSRG